MAEKTTINAICSQLLSPEEITISDTFFNEVVEKRIVTRITVKESGTSVRIFSTQRLHLSSIIPILNDFGLDIIDEMAFDLENEGCRIYINRFNLALQKSKKIEQAKTNIEQIISDALLGNTFSQCRIFSLVLQQNLTIRQLTLLRGLIEYIDQSVLSINYETILSTLTTHDELSRLFVNYFLIKFDPSVTKRESRRKEIEQQIEEAIKVVPKIMDDKILKLTYALLQSLTRTNYFLDREAIAVKIDTAAFAENLTGLQPAIETFVYHQDFSGLHLRMSRISRGGLRWSERHEDYRTEIKSLMITQEGKNAIIVPDGAKGGFVIHKEKEEITQEYFTRIYTLFIHNLLDLVDNRVGESIVREKKVVAYDGDDPYFVVAADKGTAAMSDVANAVAIERGYWLGDAFASGGSNGFSHKKLGITAKGAIKSSQRFYIEKGIDFTKESISVVGIGSMNGDVFGNGMLYSKTFRLLAAVSQKEIFIDPDPDLLVAYEERQRLFNAKNGSWSRYNKSLISEGGGIFLRGDKTIVLSEPIKKLIGTSKKTLSGEELIKKLLTMKVDLLFSGGVGTYVKSVDESNLELGDKENEAVRVDATELRCRVVCEGGNLGFTQRARIEYALGGGKINTDSIDNAAGVNTSDHEVNLKILLNAIEAKKLLDAQERDKALHALTDHVVNTVLWNSYAQSLAISRDERLSRHYLDDFMIAIELLTQEITLFNRHDFLIPKNENIHEIITKKGSIVRPVLSSLLSYAKIFLKQLVLRSSLIDDTFAQQYLFKYFPKSFVSVYEHEIKQHPLRREIIAMIISDTIINTQGTTFISDYPKLGLEKFLMKIKSYLISNQLFDANDIRYEIYRQDYMMDVSTQYELLGEIERTLIFSTRWMLRYLNDSQVDAFYILDKKKKLFELLGMISTEEPPELIKDNPEFNRFFSVIDYLRFAVAAIMIKKNSRHSFEDVAALFYLVVNEFKILQMINSLDGIEIASESDQALRRQLLQYIEFIVVHYTQKVLAFKRIGETPQTAFENYLENEKEALEGIQRQIEVLMAKEVKDIKEITVTVNQLMASAI
jgi:glutamate dehydrogenase